jgi:Na+/H+ antiporter NhaC
MKDKFRENLKFAIPAALLTIVVLFIMTLAASGSSGEIGDFDLVLIIPYLVVLIGGIIGINVFIVLAAGIVTGVVIMVGTGTTDALDVLPMIGSGMSGMLETAMVAILVSAICALIAYNGGFEALLAWIRKRFHGTRGGMIGTGLLVSAMDVATANNTVAIVMANPIAKDISKEYGLSPKRTASILDTFSCIMQGIIPYGAQMLLAISAVAAMGFTVTAFDIIPYLMYQFILLFVVLAYILFSKKEPVAEAE